MKNTTTPTIALVANSTWNIYNFRLNFIQALLRQGCRVVVIAPVDEYIHYLNRVEGITHIPLQRLSRNSTNPWQDFRLLLELSRIYRKTRPDLIIHYTIKPNIYGNFAAWFNRIRSISVITGLGYSFLNAGWIRKLTLWQYRWSFRLAKAIIFHNPDDQKLFERTKIINPAKANTILGSGVDTRFFQPATDIDKPKTLIFTFIGRLLRDKGVEEFVQAAIAVKKTYPEAKFQVIGEIDEDNPSYIPKWKLLDWVEKKVVQYLGTTKDTRPVMASASCIVLPSYREGLSKVLIEGLAMGKPIITTNVPGCRQVVEAGKNGLLVPMKDVDALTLAMEFFCEASPKEIAKMGKHSRQLALQKFDDTIIIKQYFEVIKKVLGTDFNLQLRSAPKSSTTNRK